MASDRFVQRREFLKVGSAAALGTAFAGCLSEEGGSGDDDTIKFGATFPVSGGRSSVTGWYDDAWNHYVDEMGSIEIDGRELDLDFVMLDDQNDVDQTVSNSRQLFDEEDVDIHLGTYGNENIMATAQIAQEYDKPVYNVGGAALAPAERFGGENGNLLSLTGPGTEYTKSFFETIAEDDPEPELVGLIVPDGSVYHDMQNGSEEIMDELGWDYTSETIALDEDDLSSTVQGFNDEGVDTYVNTGGHAHGVTMVTALRRFGIDPTAVYFGYEILNPEIEDSLGEDAEYLFGMNWYHDEIDLEVTEGAPWATTGEFIDSIEENIGSIDYHHAWAAAGMETALTALMRNVDWDEVSLEEATSRDYLYPKILDLGSEDTLEGPLKFNENSMNEGMVGFCYQRQEGLEPAIVGPGENAREDVQGYPHPGWD